MLVLRWQVLGCLPTLQRLSPAQKLKVAVRPSTFCLADYLQGLDKDCRPAAQAKGLAFDVHCPADAVCTSDERLLGRILRNLVDNAIKYTGACGVSLRMDGGEGLADAHWRLRGPMTMASQPGQGTVFEWHLPRGHRSPPPVALASTGVQHPPLAGLQVLVIDDGAVVRQGMQTLLLAHGCLVSLAGSTGEALRMAAVCRPAIVLTDLRLRGDASGIAAAHLLQEAHAAGIHLMHKPLTAEALLGSISQALLAAAAG